MPATSDERPGIGDANGSLDRRRFLLGLSTAALAYVTGGVGATEPSALSTVDFTVPSFDGTTLAGTLYLPTNYRSERRSVLVPHCWATSDDTARQRAASVAAEGGVALKYDARGYGASDGSTGVAADVALRDARSLVDWASDAGHLTGEVRLVVF